MNFLVTGGTGYIGNFMVKRLLDDGHKVTIADRHSRRNKEELDNGAQFLQGDLTDAGFVKDIFSAPYDGVFHFAGLISVAESMQKPGDYFRNNLQATINILDQMAESNVKSIIFSSTAAVYGNPRIVPIPEEHPKNPENPYGESKLMVESVLSWYQKIHHINSVALRYFNAAGAALDGSMGEDHNPESHIIPNAINAMLKGNPFTLYGRDYDTLDGTCVRDYIHVLDLIEAHVLALEKIKNEEGDYRYNVGTGKGYSNQEVVSMIEKISGEKLQIEFVERRSGDAAELVADPRLIQQELQFTPEHSDLETIVSSAWKWHKKNSG